ncbi:hypothetical protein BHE90_012056 [Fusarium euwallaceae]|uniref:C2H2-type domain-containing protein n=1 Tax=Fusarium euwallaceae TaxID=1147111 RepID=A0A430LCT0_9HYPO|nr:hypothetical protein BHE90_012056 [Fusarium euwallaceae]
MDRSQDRGAIAHNVHNVLSAFRNVGASLKQGAKFPDDQGKSEDLLSLLSTFENEITRFKMWAGNLAAHQSGPASLDHRLREAPHVKEQVVYLLCDISESLKDVVALILHENSPKGTKDIQDEPPPLQESAGQDSEDDFTDSDLDDDEDVSLETRLSSLCADISEATDCLLRLSVAIANPAPHERFRKLGAGPSEDVSFYEAHDIRYVRDKFPKADKALPDVLGKFITRRRQFFKYREAHHAKLAAGLDQEAQKDTTRTEIVPKTVASSLPEHFKGTAVIDEDNRSDTAISETSYATSAGFLMQEDGQMKPAPPLKVPPPPPEAEKGAFECPFCYRMISASTRRAWKRHVFGDLRPYTCLFSRCTESNTDFDRRHRWQLHVAQYHWRTWSCPFKCKDMFPSSLELEDHIRQQHLPNANNEHLNTVVARGEVPVPYDVSKECPLCRHIVSGLNAYVRHVGRHLEQLALFALPDIKDELPEDEFESDEQNDVASEMNAESVGSDGSEVSSGALESQEQLETRGVGDQVDLQIRSGEQEESDYDARFTDNSSMISTDWGSEQGHELPHPRGETTEPPTDRDDYYNVHGPNPPLGEDGGSRQSPHLTVADGVQELQRLQEGLANMLNEVTEEHKSIPGTEESPNEARGPSTGDRPPSRNLVLQVVSQYENTAVRLENIEDFQGAKKAYMMACKHLDQAIQVASGHKVEGKFQSIVSQSTDMYYRC